MLLAESPLAGGGCLLTGTWYEVRINLREALTLLSSGSRAISTLSPLYRTDTGT